MDGDLGTGGRWGPTADATKQWWRFLLVCCLLVPVVSAGMSAWYAPGPLSFPAGASYGSEPQVPVGQTFTYGLDVLAPAGDKNVTITGIRILGLDPSVHYLGARLGGPNRAYGAGQMLFRFPPAAASEDVRPALGAVITPKRVDPIGWEVFLGLQPTRPGRYVTRGLEVSYRVGWRPYTTVIPSIIDLRVHRRRPARRTGGDTARPQS